jgi:hypothetical protein
MDSRLTRLRWRERRAADSEAGRRVPWLFVSVSSWRIGWWGVERAAAVVAARESKRGSRHVVVVRILRWCFVCLDDVGGGAEGPGTEVWIGGVAELGSITFQLQIAHLRRHLTAKDKIHIENLVPVEEKSRSDSQLCMLAMLEMSSIQVHTKMLIQITNT